MFKAISLTGLHSKKTWWCLPLLLMNFPGWTDGEGKECGLAWSHPFPLVPQCWRRKDTFGNIGSSVPPQALCMNRQVDLTPGGRGSCMESAHRRKGSWWSLHSQGKIQIDVPAWLSRGCQVVGLVYFRCSLSPFRTHQTCQCHYPGSTQ